jgi:phospholipid/cholesterol/gamma-HCH transport system ATP-binding protein
MATENTTLIELRDASVVSAYTGEIVAEHVNWKLNAGEFWIVAGIHGSGKSDFLATAAGTQRPDNGEVFLFGENIARATEPELARLRLRVGLVLKHGGRMFANFTVQENVALAVRYHENIGPVEAAKKIQSVLELTALKPVADRIASTLGPNLRHRVGLARALALNPEVLLLDEPLSGLDVTGERWIFNFLSKVCAGDKPLAVVVGTNNIDPWAGHGKQFGVLQQKRWLAFAGRDELQKAMLDVSLAED